MTDNPIKRTRAAVCPIKTVARQLVIERGRLGVTNQLVRAQVPGRGTAVATCVSTWESVSRCRNRFLVGADRRRRGLGCPRRDRAVDRSPRLDCRLHRRSPIPATWCPAACYAFPSHNHCYVNYDG